MSDTMEPDIAKWLSDELNTRRKTDRKLREKIAKYQGDYNSLRWKLKLEEERLMKLENYDIEKIKRMRKERKEIQIGLDSTDKQYMKNKKEMELLNEANKLAMLFSTSQKDRKLVALYSPVVGVEFGVGNVHLNPRAIPFHKRKEPFNEKPNGLMKMVLNYYCHPPESFTARPEITITETEVETGDGYWDRIHTYMHYSYSTNMHKLKNVDPREEMKKYRPVLYGKKWDCVDDDPYWEAHLKKQAEMTLNKEIFKDPTKKDKIVCCDCVSKKYTINAKLFCFREKTEAEREKDKNSRTKRNSPDSPIDNSMDRSTDNQEGVTPDKKIKVFRAICPTKLPK